MNYDDWKTDPDYNVKRERDSREEEDPDQALELCECFDDKPTQTKDIK
jgi:hypothetical protein